MNSQTTSPIRLLSHPVAICLLLALATLAVYFPVKNFDFAGYDDSGYFFANDHVLGGLTWANIKWAFTSGEQANWHPLTWLSLMLDAQLFGKGATAPHITNVLLHLGNSILVFVLARRWTAALWRSVAVAMLFAIHPQHVESVAWVAERKDVLSGFFGLLTLLSYTQYARSGRVLSLPYGLAIFFFACGLMSKPILVTLPFVMLLLDFWPLQRFEIFALARLLIEKIPFFLLIMASSVVTFLVQQKGGAVHLFPGLPLGARIENAFISFACYLMKFFWPVNLAIPYPHPIHRPAWPVISAIVLFSALCLAALVLRKRFPYVFTGWFWFVGMLIPVIGLVQIGNAAMADRYMYFSSIGLLIAVIWGIAEVCARWRVPPCFIVFAAMFLLLACGLQARSQVDTWKDDESLYVHAVTVTKDNYVATQLLAYWYSTHGNVGKALDYYHRSLQISNDLAILLYSKDEHGQVSRSYYFNTLSINTNDPTDLYNAGNASAKLGYWDEAIRDYRRALQITPNQPDILANLGYALTQDRQLADATVCFQAVLKLNPDSLEAHNNLATVFFLQTNFDEAAKQFYAALQLSPDDERLCANLARAYARLGQTNLAVQYYQQALRLQPGDQRARVGLQALGATLR
ncbi:MAG TPA: tetratricopeptide repeat protein [Candidatus Acidoferrales bacterium]|nr:tetratricopeptide repeat protein [Candidatus Acidoferrales bacterium]